GDSLKVIGGGLNTGLTHDPVLTPEQLARLTVSADQEPFDGDARLFRLGVEAHRLGLAYEYDRSSPCPSRASIRCRTSSRRSTTTSCACPAFASSSPTTRGLARRSWPVCFSRS